MIAREQSNARTPRTAGAAAPRMLPKSRSKLRRRPQGRSFVSLTLFHAASPSLPRLHVQIMTRRNGNYVCNYRRARRRKSEIASPLNSVRPTAAASFKTPRPSLGAASLEQTKIYLCACCMWHFLPVALERKAMKKEGNLSRDERCEGKKARAGGRAGRQFSARRRRRDLSQIAFYCDVRPSLPPPSLPLPSLFSFHLSTFPCARHLPSWREGNAQTWPYSTKK